MTENDILIQMAMNREAMAGWVLSAVGLTLGGFAIAYLIRSTPVWVRSLLFVSFALTVINLYTTMGATNGALLGLAQELAQQPQLTEYSQAGLALMGATSTQAPTLPLHVRIGLPLIQLLNIVVGFYLFLLAKWNR
jgi:hypothetical protein